MMIPYRTNNGSKSPVISNPVDIAGTFHPTLYADSDIPEGEITRAHHPAARYYAEFLELKQLTSYASDATEHFMSPFKCIVGHVLKTAICIIQRHNLSRMRS